MKHFFDSAGEHLGSVSVGSIKDEDSVIIENNEVYDYPVRLADGQIVRDHEQELQSAKRGAVQSIKAYATSSRRQIVEYADEVKLAEYVDKAGLAPRLIDGTASDEEKQSALGDAWAVANNITDLKQIGETWLQRANALRLARNTVNTLEAQALLAIADAELADMPAMLEQLKQQAQIALEAIMGEAS